LLRLTFPGLDNFSKSFAATQSDDPDARSVSVEESVNDKVNVAEQIEAIEAYEKSIRELKEGIPYAASFFSEKIA
jgi:hypothetical protein